MVNSLCEKWCSPSIKNVEYDTNHKNEGFICIITDSIYTQLLAERLAMPCNAQHARKLSRQYVCSLLFSKTEFTLGDETILERLAVPNSSIVA